MASSPVVLRASLLSMLVALFPWASTAWAQGSEKPILPTEVGTAWEYRLIAQLYPRELKLLPTGEMGYPDPKTVEGRRRMEIAGQKQFGRSEGPVTHYVTLIQGNPISEEFSKVTKDFVVSYGGRTYAKGDWIEQILDPPLKTLQSDLRRGASWTAASTVGDKKLLRRFDVFGNEEVTVPAGTYDAVKVRFVGSDDQGGLVKRYLWIARGIGAVKSKTIHISGGKLSLIELETLESFTPGNGTTSVMLPEERTATPVPVEE